MHRAACLAFVLAACFSETENLPTSTSSSGSDTTSASTTGSTGAAVVLAHDACLAIMDRWWDGRICPPPEDDAAWCFTMTGDRAFTPGDRLDLCTLLVDQYAIPETIESDVLEQCLADMLTEECWAWHSDSDNCDESTCSAACDAIRIIDFCYQVGGDVCDPAGPLDGCY